MTKGQQLATHLKQLITGPNQTGSHFSQHLDDITLEDATTSIYGLNTIAHLVFHCWYYIDAVSGVLDGRPLIAKDALSYDLPPLHNDLEWQALRTKLYAAINTCAHRAEHLDDDALKNPFVSEKYGTYERNLMGLLEHSNYHFGQIVIIKKIIRFKKQEIGTDV